MNTTKSKTRRRRLACPDCGGREFDSIASGTQRDVVVFYDDGEAKIIHERGLDIEWSTLECAQCDRTVEDTDELV